jgi:hypothetical protein
MGHRSFLPQEVVWQNVRTGGLQKRHTFKRRFPRREMQSTTHLNEPMQYTFKSQSMVQSHRDQNKTWTCIVPNQ